MARKILLFIRSYILKEINVIDESPNRFIDNLNEVGDATLYRTESVPSDNIGFYRIELTEHSKWLLKGV